MAQSCEGKAGMSTLSMVNAEVISGRRDEAMERVRVGISRSG